MNTALFSPPLPSGDMTAEDFRRLPEGPPYHELIDGELILQESPTTGHQDAIGELFYAVRKWVEGSHPGRVFMSPLDVYLTDRNVFHPDLLFVSQRRQAIIQPDGVYGGPDLVVEVLSPSTACRDRGRKREVYAESGVLEMWHLDGVRREVAVYRFETMRDRPVRVLDEKAVLTSRLLPGFAVALADVFNPKIS